MASNIQALKSINKNVDQSQLYGNSQPDYAFFLRVIMLFLKLGETCHRAFLCFYAHTNTIEAPLPGIRSRLAEKDSIGRRADQI